MKALAKEVIINGKPTVRFTPKCWSDIHVLHREIGDTEWSGICFYRVIKGSIADPDNFEIECIKVAINDIGTPGATSFDFGWWLVDLYEKDPDLMECKYAIIHTHHNMGVTPSTTDQRQLHEMAEHFDYNLQLIVNFRGQVTARFSFEGIQETASIKYKSNKFDFNQETEVNEEQVLFIVNCKTTVESEVYENIQRVREEIKNKQFSYPKTNIFDTSKTYQQNLFDEETNAYDRFNSREYIGHIPTVTYSIQRIEDFLAKVISGDVTYTKEITNTLYTANKLPFTQFEKRINNVVSKCIEWLLKDEFITFDQYEEIMEKIENKLDAIPNVLITVDKKEAVYDTIDYTITNYIINSK